MKRSKRDNQKIKDTLVFLMILFTCILMPNKIFAQNNKQNIRGVVIDKLSQTPLIGATVKIINNSENKGAISDKMGNYKISDLAHNRYELKISYIGYKNVFIPNVVVSSGKETLLDISMEEEFKLTNEVIVTANEKGKTINDLATVSAREFSMEEVNRYAGGRSDPARLAANFAGVSATDDSRNDIVIRGNSPVGVLWRINGMNVTNPNHFATVGTTGSAVSALNTNMLKSSDFLTSAFPAEYGNAISGVFDIGFRNGNSQKRETTIQAGVITGLEATTEGPISQENNSSYLVGYRYALAGVAQAVGIDIGTTATPSYQDLSFNVNSGNTDLEDSLTNAGTGRNYGFELTIEKFFSDGYYGLFTSSIYESKYTASDGVERNSAFNGRYALNLLFGKEWSLGNDKLSADLKESSKIGLDNIQVRYSFFTEDKVEIIKDDKIFRVKLPLISKV